MGVRPSPIDCNSLSSIQVRLWKEFNVQIDTRTNIYVIGGLQFLQWLSKETVDLEELRTIGHENNFCVTIEHH
ncbi:hypothetical protein C5167_042893 [Papaver somniferum]|uniref:Uncharacterized protein n=1 Tax=Papaver somniferum TaxID=3469 RepID=A0A4Y7L6S9_PAPSO|nr:hypothetical protein C5167_042893 [Papaver somniferum]